MYPGAEELLLILLQNTFQKAQLAFIIDLPYSIRALLYYCQAKFIPFSIVKKSSYMTSFGFQFFGPLSYPRDLGIDIDWIDVSW